MTEEPGSCQKVLIALTGEKTGRPDVMDALRCGKSVSCALSALGFSADFIWVKPSDFRNTKKLAEKIDASGCICVFNLFEGFGKDASKEIDLAEILETAGIPFTGNPSRALRNCLDKQHLKSILASKEIRTPRGLYIRKLSDLGMNPFTFPLFIKPCCEDASVGIDPDSLVMNPFELEASVREKIKKFPRGLVVEEFIPGLEVNVGLLGRYPYTVVGVSHIDYDHFPDLSPFLSYASKWNESSQEYKMILPQVYADNRPDFMEDVIDIARRAGEAAGCRGYFRVETSSSEKYQAARDFYARKGFIPAGRIPDFYAKGDDLMIYYLNADAGEVNRF